MNFLQEILTDTRRRVAVRRARRPLTELERIAADRPEPPDFTAALRRPGIRIIAELKCASPSRGVIRKEYPVAELAGQLESNGAAALSVLTEESRFRGSLYDLESAAGAVKIPLLRKDFIVDPYQIVEARCAGASAVLLIAAALDRGHFAELAACARENGLAVLAEAHSAPEVERLLALEMPIIGVNARDLTDFRCSLSHSAELLRMIPDDRIAVAESAISSRDEIEHLRESGAAAFLIGETLMRSPRPGERLAELLK